MSTFRAARATLAFLAAAATALVVAAGGSAVAAPGSAAHLAALAPAPATPLLPPGGAVFTGVSISPTAPFQAEAGKHPAIYGEFVTWGERLNFAFDKAAGAHARLMLHISTTMGFGAAQKITPLGIAQGAGDGFLLALHGLIAHYARPVYIRLFPEMDNANNAYSAVNLDGSSRGPRYAPSAFLAAWRRVVIVLRGGSVASIDAQLAALGQSPLHGLGASASITTPAVSFVWTPQVAGLPDVAGNSPAAYWPGSAYVDWVGTDFYSRFPNFTGLDAFYKQYPEKPFAFTEWAIWGGDNPAFVRQLFKWVDARKRVQMMVYNQGYTNSPFRLNVNPASAASIRQQLAAPRYLAFTPDW